MSKHWRRLVQRKLLLRVTIPALIGLVLLTLAGLDLIRGHVPPAVLLWIIPGIALGFLFGRQTKVAWDSDTSQIVQDGSGLVLLVAFLAVRFGLGFLLSPRFLEIAYISNAAALVGAGLLLGRAWGTRRAIRLALRAGEQ